MREIKTIAVIGAGQMGSGIAQIAASHGYRVLVQDISAEAQKKSIKDITASLERQIAKGKLSAEDKQKVLESICFVSALEDLCAADFVIEAAPENLSLKQEIFQALGRICAEDAILCTNTSSISIGEITRNCAAPERCVGLHFFFPVQAMRLVEVIRSEKTSNETVNRVKAVAEAIGKTAVECKTDTPGFIVNRCLFAFMLEAIREYEEGVASIEDIDTAVKLGLNHPLGPFEMMDLSGLDTFPHVTETLEALGTTSWHCPESVQQKIAEQKFGRKSGEGWYAYSTKR